MSTEDALAAIQVQLEQMNSRMEKLEKENGELKEENKALRNGEADIDRSNMPETNAELVDQFVTEKGRKKSTADTERRFIKRITEWSDGKHLADMTDDDLLAWVQQTDTSSVAKYSYLGSFKKMYDWMEKKGWVADNPAEDARETGGFEAGSNTKTGLGNDAIDPRLSEA